jgi:hypothetical protein
MDFATWRVGSLRPVKSLQSNQPAQGVLFELTFTSLMANIPQSPYVSIGYKSKLQTSIPNQKTTFASFSESWRVESLLSTQRAISSSNS